MKKIRIHRASITIIIFLLFSLLGSGLVYSQDAQSFYKTGYEYFLQENYQKAEEYYKNAIDQNPDFEKAHYWLGKVYVKTRDYGKAVQQWREVLRINTQNQYAFWNLLNSYTNTSSVKSNSANDYINEGIRLIGNPGVYLEDDNAPSIDALLSSVPYFNKSIDIEPDLIESYYWIAEVYRILGVKLTSQFFNLSIENYEKAIDTEEARNTISFSHPSDYWFAYSQLGELLNDLRMNDKKEKLWLRLENARILPYQQALQDKGYINYGFPPEIEVELVDEKYVEYWIYPEKSMTFIFEDGEIKGEKEDLQILPIIEQTLNETESIEISIEE